MQEIKAQKIMAKLGAILEKEKDNTKINSAYQRKSKKLKIGGNFVRIKTRWDNLGVQIEKVRRITSKLQRVEELLTKLPASKRAKLQTCFSNLCAEADIVVNKVNGRMKVHCDESQSFSSVYAPTLEPSS